MNFSLRLALGALLLAAHAFAQSAAPQDNWTPDFSFTGASSGGAFSFPAGVAVAPGDKIVLADVENSRVQVFDSTGGFLLRFGSQGSAAGQFAYSTESSLALRVAAMADGKIVVSDQANNRIQIFNADGTFVRTFGAYGAGNGQFYEPWGVAVTADGKIVVADTRNKRVQVFESDGTFIRSWGNGESYSPTELAVDSNGNVVTWDQSNKSISVFTVGGTLVRTWSAGFYTRGLVGLSGGRIAVVDSENSRIVIFGPDGTVSRTWGGRGAEGTQIGLPFGVAVMANGNIVVPDYNSYRVKIFDETGVFKLQFGRRGSSNDGFSPTTVSIETDTAGRIYVAQQSWPAYPQVQVFSPAGEPLAQLDLPGFSNNFSMKIGPDDRLYVGYTVGFAIYELTGELVRQIGVSSGSGDGQFANYTTIQLAIDTNGDVYATDPGNGRVQVFNVLGTFLRKFGSAGTGPDQLSEVNGIALTPDGRLALSGNSSLRYFTKAGQFLGQVTNGSSLTLMGFGTDGLPYRFSSGGTGTMSGAGGMVVCAGADHRTGAVYTFDVAARRVQVWRRGYRTVGELPPRLVPIPGIRQVARRSNGYIDIDYNVIDGDSATVSTALAAFKGGSYLLRDMIPVSASALVEGTAAKVGTGIATGTVHRVTWNPASAGLPAGKVVFEVFARDDRPGLLDIEYVTLPTTPALTISRIPFTHADLRAAWAWLVLNGEPGLSRDASGEITGPGGVFTTTVGTETRTTAAGRAWLFAKLGVREATTAETTAARLATAATTPNQFAPLPTARMGERPQVVNEWSIETNSSTEAWLVVRVP